MKALLTGILTLLGAAAVVGLAVCAIELLGRWANRGHVQAGVGPGWANRGHVQAGVGPGQEAEAEPFLSYDDVFPQPPIRHVHVYRGGGWHGPKRTDADFDQFLADCLAKHEDQKGDETR